MAEFAGAGPGELELRRGSKAKSRARNPNQLTKGVFLGLISLSLMFTAPSKTSSCQTVFSKVSEASKPRFSGAKRASTMSKGSNLTRQKRTASASTTSLQDFFHSFITLSPTCQPLKLALPPPKTTDASWKQLYAWSFFQFKQTKLQSCSCVFGD